MWANTYLYRAVCVFANIHVSAQWKPFSPSFTHFPSHIPSGLLANRQPLRFKVYSYLQLQTIRKLESVSFCYLPSFNFHPYCFNLQCGYIDLSSKLAGKLDDSSYMAKTLKSLTCTVVPLKNEPVIILSINLNTFKSMKWSCWTECATSCLKSMP